MLNNTTVVTYHSPTHVRFYDNFRNSYNSNFKSHISYDMDWVKSQPFYKENIKIFSYIKYFGYFLWKPYIILDAFYRAETDHILYCDSNIQFKNILAFNNIYYDTITENGFFFVGHRNFINKDWTKRDAFYYMGADDSRYWNANQIWSVIMGFTQSNLHLSLLTEYLNFCRDERILTELPNTCGIPNLEGFREHRWEQSVMSILVEKYRIPIHCWDTEVIHYVDKYYDEGLLKLKAEVNEDPLRKE
jgi:hypothetical protein